MSGDSSAEREHDPTPQRLEEARRKGDVAQSADLTAAAAAAGFLLSLALFGPGLVDGIGRTGVTMLAMPDQMGRAELSAAAVRVLLAFLPLVLLPAGAAVLCLVAQQSLVLATGKIAPKLSRISPLATARQRFGGEGIADFLKGTAKMILVGTVLAVFLLARLPEIFAAQGLAPGQAARLMGELLLAFLAMSLALSLVLGGLDYLRQRMRFLKRNRMTRQELIDEMKRSEGDPQLKAQRRQRGREIATNRMLADVPQADVVIVNPTHYAVALKWDRKARQAPVCVAKGVDEIAARIRERAAAAGVPIHRDPPTARLLHATLEIGQEIRPDQYRAVAAAIRFADAMRLRARRRVTA
jgi:flagellar biosynthetic protein FlhB